MNFGVRKIFILVSLFYLLGSCSQGDRFPEAGEPVSISTKLRLVRVPLPWHEPIVREAAGDRVVFLHGLWRSHHAMDDLADELHEQGYETVNLPYPSFRKGLDEIVENVVKQLGDSKKTTHFVTHSMGGIVLRKLANDHPEQVTGRVVMLAPPNQGSEVIDWMEDCSFAQWALGPGGMALSTQEVLKKVPQLSGENEVGVIMGNEKNLRCFQPLLDGDNDGIVTVEGGMVEGVSELIVVPENHAFIMASPEVKDQILSFLEKGRFESD